MCERVMAIEKGAWEGERSSGDAGKAVAIYRRGTNLEAAGSIRAAQVEGCMNAEANSKHSITIPLSWQYPSITFLCHGIKN